jgi:hypothetical protein
MSVSPVDAVSLHSPNHAVPILVQQAVVAHVLTREWNLVAFVLSYPSSSSCPSYAHPAFVSLFLSHFLVWHTLHVHVVALLPAVPDLHVCAQSNCDLSTRRVCNAAAAPQADVDCTWNDCWRQGKNEVGAVAVEAGRALDVKVGYASVGPCIHDLFVDAAQTAIPRALVFLAM